MFVGNALSGDNTSRIVVYDLNPSTNILDDKVPDAFLGVKSNIVNDTNINQTYGVYGLAYDEVGKRLFASDPGNKRVLVYDVTSITDNEPAINVLGQVDFTSSGIVDLGFPTSLAYDPVDGMLYVSSSLSSNGTVNIYDVASITDGEARVNFLGQAATNAGKFQYSAGLAFDDNRHLFVNDYGNSRVLVFDIATITNSENAINVLGQPDLTTVNPCSSITATSICINNFPYTNLAFDPARHYMYVGMVNRVLVFDIATLSDNPSAINVLGQADFVSNNSGNYEYTATSLQQIYSLAYDPSTLRLYTVDVGYRIGIFDLTTIADNEPMIDLLGQQNIFTYEDINSPLYNQSDVYSNSVIDGVGFNTPTDVALDPDGHKLFVLDSNVSPYNTRILVFNLDASNNLIDNVADNVIGVVAPNNQYSYSLFGVYLPLSMTFDSDNDFLYFSDSTSSNVLFGVDVSTVDQHEDIVVTVGDGSLPVYGAAHDSVHGRLFSIQGTDIVVYDVSDGLSDAELPIYTLGQAPLFQNPTALEYDPNHDRLFVADVTNSHINIYDFNLTPLANGVEPSNVLGAPDLLTPGNVGASRNTFSLASGISGFSFDPDADQLFVTDGQNNRVLIFDVTTIVDGEDAVAVIGQSDFTQNSAETSRDGLSLPTDMVFDTLNRRLYVADSENNRVIYYGIADMSTETLPNSTEGVAYSSPEHTVTNSQGAVTYELVSGVLPSGLTLDAATGSISGTPAAASAGTYNFSIQAIDTVAESTFKSNKVAYTITVADAPGGGGCSSNCGGVIVLCTDPLASNNGSQNACVYTPPTIIVTSPVGAGLTTQNGIITITGTATDNDTITSVSYVMNGSASTSTVGTTSWSIPTVSLLPGSNTVTITATNNHNQVATVNLTIIYSQDPVVPEDPTCATNPTLPGCGQVVVIPKLCADGLDNDGDGKTDFPADPGCSSLNDNSETDPPALCQDPAAQNFGGALPCIPADPVDPVDPIDPVDPEVVDPPIDPEGGGGGGSVIDDISQVLSERVTNIFSTIGLIIGSIATLLSMFGGGLALSEILLIPARLWQLLLGVLGFKKKVRHWGVVYDSVTKQPLDPAYVSLFDADGKEVSTAITDLEGRYGFLVTPGFYRIEAHKTNYIFPSKKLATQSRDQIYAELYFGDYFEIKAEGEVVAKNIPLDQENFDWNEYVKHERKLTKQHLLRAKVVNVFSGILFYVGFLFALFALIMDANTFTIVVFCLYILLFLLRQFVIKKPSYGAVSDKGEPIPYGVVKIYSKKLGTLLSTKVLDKYGRYYALAPKGTYYAVVDQKNEDQSYTSLHTTDAFDATKGVINKKFKI
jgi:sugar lactone lactonase YvrE